MDKNQLATRLRDASSPPIVIAEAADTHFGSLETALKIVDKVQETGADFVKFQHHIADEEMLPELPTASNMKEPLYDFLKKNSLSIHDHKVISEYCNDKGIGYLCTPFSLKAAQELKTYIAPVAFKIGSGEMLDFPTIKGIMDFGDPLIVSTGMSTIAEVDELYELIRLHNTDFVMLSCGSAYPPSPEDLNLSFVPTMNTKYRDAFVGFSDHSTNLVASIAAATLGARVIEKHIQLDGSPLGPDSEVSISLSQLRELVESLSYLAVALNAEKDIHPNEWETRIWSHRSIVYTRDLKAGHRIGPEDVWSKRPGTGVPAREMPKLIGLRLVRDVDSNTQLDWKDLSH